MSAMPAVFSRVDTKYFGQFIRICHENSETCRLRPKTGSLDSDWLIFVWPSAFATFICELPEMAERSILHASKLFGNSWIYSAIRIYQLYSQFVGQRHKSRQHGFANKYDTGFVDKSV